MGGRNNSKRKRNKVTTEKQRIEQALEGIGNYLHIGDYTVSTEKVLGSDNLKTIRQVLEEKLNGGWNYNIDEAPRDGDVLVMYGEGVRVAYKSRWDGMWTSEYGHALKQPMAWMPLPQPPNNTFKKSENLNTSQEHVEGVEE